ncbi:CocE/NonD family hydrolase C-terminal non-catalytic domain-containing protein [Paraburkholderia sp. MPAMCS5]|uniref:CocE/NonD family hydrolase C-terminal non-catalytic domain-containing protein n=1 Tax=Paraburkholderia sp. MPAMCS5 TaxID=3112563 RepID=UPI002E19A6D3|nr:CocE/NonD family hydrolase C-terminal non-catalytic domain-containing protein [Paraburkholderia sp. MPAMCS5]
MNIAGHAVATLRMAVDQGDASIFVYPSEVDIEGRAFYMTEGLLRAIYRKTLPAPSNYVTAWPFRSL